MCDINLKRPAADVNSLTHKRIKCSEDCVLTGQNTSTSSEQCMGNDRVQPVAEFGDNIVKIPVSPVSYCEKMLLQPEELLLYALIKISSNNEDFTFAKGSPEKFVYISRAVYNVYGISFTGNDLRNYFYRSMNNLTKGLGKYQGRLRWKFYSKTIQSVITSHRSALTDLLVFKPVSDQSIRDLRDCFELECLSVLNESEESSSLAWKVDKDAKLISKKFPNWHVNADISNGTLHLYYMSNSLVHPAYEVIVSANGDYKFILGGKSRTTCITSMPKSIHTCKDLYSFMRILEKHSLCPGVSIEKYHDLPSIDSDVPIFKNKDGQPAAFVEPIPSNYDKKLIRSSNCSLFLPIGGACLQCESCFRTDHYMRTLKSRSKNTSNNTFAKFTRYDYMTKDQLVEHSRRTAETLHGLQVRLRRLQEHQESMATVGSETDSDLKKMFTKLYSGFKNISDKHTNIVCCWQNCETVGEFVSTEQLFDHIKQLHIPPQVDVVPFNRQYVCKWLGCDKTFSKKKQLESHIVGHTGSESDSFFLLLLQDQAKALNMPSRQMRWHPMVLKWCLRLYCKSHSTYSELRDSGFLRLPSGRTLSDYKNSCSSKSGWQTSVFQRMKSSCEQQNIPNVGKLGALIFDEVKIKEGLLFDPSSWELIGFVDLECDETSLASTCKPTTRDKLASHVLQFYFKSVFSSFNYPCGYFLTKGISATQLNRIFWEGVGMLHAHNFEVIVSICDGAPENRTFMDINGCNETVSKTHNPFSNCPLFFLSDPPHLLKKLRNNLYNSGHKDMCPRYTRCLSLDSKDILWDHVYSVYLRDKQRHLFSTDLRSSHVHLDSLSKMRVKLAVQVLNSKVQADMEKYEADITSSTQKFILNCETLWNVFNDTTPLSSETDVRLGKIEDVLDFFKKWKNQLAQQFSSKTEQSSRFISWQTFYDLQVTKMEKTHIPSHIKSQP